MPKSTSARRLNTHLTLSETYRKNYSTETTIVKCS